MSEYLRRGHIAPDEIRRVADELGLPAPHWEEPDGPDDFDATWIKESDREEFTVFFNEGEDPTSEDPSWLDGVLWFMDFRERDEDDEEGAIRDRDHLREVLRRVL